MTTFVVAGLRVRGTPLLPWLSRLPEPNVRAYVDYGGHPGIYFFRLDAARLAAVAAARWAHPAAVLPREMSARHQGGTVHYKSKRVDSSGPFGPAPGALRRYGPRLSVDDGSLERWLAERYCVYVVDEHKLALRAHPPSTLAAAARRRHDRAEHDGAARARARLRSGLHYSARQDTLIWALEPA